ncbi:hypothetical protein BDV12DRAFT_198889 [Aspergillus spectabilis]
MASEHRITESNPIHSLGYMDYERCAALHNELFIRGWTGSGNTWVEPPTWWEKYSPTEKFANRLHPSLIKFLKLAYHIPRESRKVEHKWKCIFYFISSLSGAEYMLSRLGVDFEFLGYAPDRFLLLYPSTGYRLGDEEGIVFDQHTLKATYIPFTDNTSAICQHEWGWMPLEVILDAYLQMADEGKVSIMRDFSIRDYYEKTGHYPVIEDPWMMNFYTKIDVSKAVAALHRLVDAIDIRIGNSSRPNMPLPWHDPVTLNPELVAPSSFTHEFLSAISVCTVRFQYLAPGIRFPTVSEFLDQPFTKTNTDDGLLRLFRIDYKEEQQPEACQQIRISGFYIDQLVEMHPFYFPNGSQLYLPFEIGANGWARMSNGEPLSVNPEDENPTPRNDNSSLYQSGWINGFVNYRLVQIHKVLESWAERVEKGDWEVGDDGVLGGIDKFREADTEEHWRKYWIPPSW